MNLPCTPKFKWLAIYAKDIVDVFCLKMEKSNALFLFKFYLRILHVDSPILGTEKTAFLTGNQCTWSSTDAEEKRSDEPDKTMDE